MLEYKRVLVIGAGGTIGNALINNILQQSNLLSVILPTLADNTANTLVMFLFNKGKKYLAHIIGKIVLAINTCCKDSTVTCLIDFSGCRLSLCSIPVATIIKSSLLVFERLLDILPAVFLRLIWSL